MLTAASRLDKSADGGGTGSLKNISQTAFFSYYLFIAAAAAVCSSSGQFVTLVGSLLEQCTLVARVCVCVHSYSANYQDVS